MLSGLIAAITSCSYHVRSCFDGVGEGLMRERDVVFATRKA